MRLDKRGSTAVEFAIIATPLMLLLFSTIEFGRMMWTLQALQLAGDQTARCVAIGATACATPSSFALARAQAFGAGALVASGVTVSTETASSSPVVCTLSGSNTAALVKLTLAFNSAVATLLPGISQNLTTNSCYPLTGT
jgi:Flp pilus assembly protein TadG